MDKLYNISFVIIFAITIYIVGAGLLLLLLLLHSQEGKSVPDRAVAPCLIKGDIRRENQKIYYATSSLFYSVLKINLNEGERWFCTEDAAINAGWEKSKF